MEAEDVPALPPLIDRSFDAATYRLRIHAPSSGGIFRFEGLIPRIDKDILLREPTSTCPPMPPRIPIPCDLDMTQWRAAQCQLLGVILDTTNHGIVRYNWFFEYFSEFQPTTPNEVAQYTRGFLMYLLSTTLFANRENTVWLYLLGALVHLSQVAEYDWGGIGLATLYCYMSSVSRRKVDSLGGYWKV
ncbi:hypothetical protein ACSBR2_035204 [Camellia fascicularis]